ncbi:sensor histidine kinase [Devosia sp.]|uniref:sensor histidine kinase n=1 Tax=Devosia sp. TaxID=1871048 RepID=UPI003F7080CE
MKPRSLRLRLVLAATLWSLLTLGAASAVITLIFGETVRRDQLEDLGASLDVLTAELARTMPNPDDALYDPRYRTPAGGLYYQVDVPGTEESLRSRSLWDTRLTLPAPPRGEDLLTTAAGPESQSLALLVRDVELAGQGVAPRRLRIAVGEDLTVRGHSVMEFGSSIAIAMAIVAALLFVAVLLIVQFGLRPVRAIERGIEQIRAGRVERLDERVPAEFGTLVREVNSLLDVHERGVQLSRERADDLAHGLKTPLAVMRATAERLRQAGDDSNSSALELLSEEMAARIDYQLRLTHLRIRSDNLGFGTPVDQALLRSVAVIRKTGRGADLFWHLSADKVSANIDAHDLMELVGVLLENAAKWARSEVVVSCGPHDGMARFMVTDDGPGLLEGQIEQLGIRGKRLDEHRSGNGFGIAIAKEVVRLNSGTVAFDKAAAGGLSVVVLLPLASQT